MLWNPPYTQTFPLQTVIDVFDREYIVNYQYKYNDLGENYTIWELSHLHRHLPNFRVDWSYIVWYVVQYLTNLHLSIPLQQYSMLFLSAIMVMYITVDDKLINKIIVVFKPLGIDGSPSNCRNASSKLKWQQQHG